MKNLFLVGCLLISYMTFGQTMSYKGDTLLTQTKTSEGYVIKYMKSGQVVKTVTSPTPMIGGQTSTQMYTQHSGFKYTTNSKGESKKTYFQTKESILKNYKDRGWKIKGRSNYGNSYTYTLERGDVLKGTYCSMVLSFIGNKLEGKSESCL